MLDSWTHVVIAMLAKMIGVGGVVGFLLLDRGISPHLKV